MASTLVPTTTTDVQPLGEGLQPAEQLGGEGHQGVAEQPLDDDLDEQRHRGDDETQHVRR